MKLQLVRKYKLPKYTIGKLYVDNRYFCDTLEDTDKGLDQSMSEAEITSKKLYGQTAIPTGTYKVSLDTISPKFKDRSWATFCNGRLPRLLNVKGYSGVLIHVGNSCEDTLGCILVGQNKVKGKVINSSAVFQNLYKELLKDKDNLTIEIK